MFRWAIGGAIARQAPVEGSYDVLSLHCRRRDTDPLGPVIPVHPKGEAPASTAAIARQPRKRRTGKIRDINYFNLRPVDHHHHRRRQLSSFSAGTQILPAPTPSPVTRSESAVARRT